MTPALVPIPGSRSPLGRFLSIEPLDSGGTNRIVVKESNGNSSPLPRAEDDLLRECIGGVVAHSAPDYCRDFDYSVVWSADSRWFVIEGGAHKYWSCEVFAIAAGRIVEHKLPANATIREWIHKHCGDPALKADPPFVIAIRPGVFGFLSHPLGLDQQCSNGHHYVPIDFRHGTTGVLLERTNVP